MHRIDPSNLDLLGFPVTATVPSIATTANGGIRSKEMEHYFFWNLELLSVPGVTNDTPNDFSKKPQNSRRENNGKLPCQRRSSIVATHCRNETNFYRRKGVDSTLVAL